MGLWPWGRVHEALSLIPDLLFLRDFHVTQAGIMAASAMGAKIEKHAHELMHPGSLPESMRGMGQGGGLRLRLKGGQERDFRLALTLGLVSQRLLNYYVDA